MKSFIIKPYTLPSCALVSAISLAATARLKMSRKLLVLPSHPSSLFPLLAADELAKKLLEEEDGSPPSFLFPKSQCARERERE